MTLAELRRMDALELIEAALNEEDVMVWLIAGYLAAEVEKEYPQFLDICHKIHFCSHRSDMNGARRLLATLREKIKQES